MKNVKEEESGFTRLASFVCDCEPFTEEELEGIEASLSNPNNKRRFDDLTPRRRRLPESLIALQHPNISSLSRRPGYSRMRLPAIKFSGRIMYSRTFDSVQKAVAKLLQALDVKNREIVQFAIGFDIEWKPSFHKGVPPGKVAVMQICTDSSHCHVLHLIHPGIPPNLQLLLEDPTVLKVGVGIDSDATKVFRDYKISVKGVTDLSFHANQKLGGDHKWGLSSLTEKLLSKQLKKPNKIRLGNWETPVLSKEQLEYAATDAFASWYLYQAIKDLPDLSAFVTAAAISTTTTISRRFPCLEIAPPKPKHPQHLLSLLLKHPSQPKILQQIHCHIITSGLFHYPFHDTSTCLLLFNNVIRCYSRGPSPHLALHFFSYTQHPHTFFTYPSLDTFSFVFLCNASANPTCTHFGIQLHALIFKVGFQFHVYVQTGLLQMYSSWGLSVEAAQVFYQMPRRSLVTWNVFLTGLIKWEEVELALSVFNQMPSRSVVSWTLVIDGYTRRNQPTKALTLFREMIEVDGIEPTQVTLLTIFPAIANIGCIKICQSAHGYAEKRGFNSSDIRITNALIDLYAKCGCIASVNRFLQELPDQRKNLVSWTSAISGFAMNGMGREALETFENMEKAGLRPNRVTFLSVLSACSHGGLVEEGLNFFGKMGKDCEVVPDIKHYGCVIDMLGRAGRLEEAEKVASEVPHEVANAVMWRTLLGACSVHNNVEIGLRVTRKVLEMERGHGGDYVLMSNILVGVGRFKDAQRLRDMIDERIAFKLPGYSIV